MSRRQRRRSTSRPLPLSLILQDMILTILADPRSVPSSEALHAALLFAHVAWNRSLGASIGRKDYAPTLREFEHSNPDLWKELRSGDAETLIGELETYRDRHHRDDTRLLMVCGTRHAGNEERIHAEWIDRGPIGGPPSRARGIA